MASLISRFLLPVNLALLLVLAITGEFFSSSPLVIACQVTALAIMVSARLTFSRQKFNLTAEPASGPLVDRGPYRIIRHPMYTGAILLFISSILGHPSPLSGFVGLLAILLILYRIRIEERMLSSHYPDYSAYMQRTKRIIPYFL